MTNSADPDQFASSEANWSGSTVFFKDRIYPGSAGLGLKGLDTHGTLSAIFYKVNSFYDFLPTNAFWKWGYSFASKEC